MKRQSKLNSQEQGQQLAQGQAQTPAAREFATPEELLRHDALHTLVPPRIEERLQESIGKEPRPPRPWWRKFFPS